MDTARELAVAWVNGERDDVLTELEFCTPFEAVLNVLDMEEFMDGDSYTLLVQSIREDYEIDDNELDE